MRSIAFVLLVLMFVVAGCNSDSKQSVAASDTASTPACASCATGKSGGTAWCKSCNMGFVKGKKVMCRACYVAKTGGAACAVCAKKN
jgi:nitrate/TMAO reductase-like tetraheme cytochrome c subunit